jgi:hypothetical protein
VHAYKIGLVPGLVCPEEQPFRFEKNHGAPHTVSPPMLSDEPSIGREGLGTDHATSTRLVSTRARICLILLTLVWYFICHYHRPESRATMSGMTRFLQFRFVLGMLCLALGLSFSDGCTRSEPLHRSDSVSAASEQQLPFRPEADQTSDTEGAHAALSPDPKATSALPFRTGSQRILPSGTLLTVQLEDALSTAKVRAGDTFMASVAAPLAIEGDPLIERGTEATGHVESVRSHAGSGYFQLTLSAITVEGRHFALQTSSLFARGTSQQPDGVRVQKGRRLTFRLMSPVTLNDPNSLANRQFPSPSSE